MHRRLPPLAVLLGLAGLIPFIGGALGSLGSTDLIESGRSLAALIAYAAVILAFLGAVHWGFVLGAPALEAFAVRAARARYRLVLGVLPALVAWVALLALLALNLPELSLAVLIAGYVALVVAEAELRRRDLVPPSYMWLRWGLTIVVVLILGTVLSLRLIGAHIMF